MIARNDITHDDIKTGYNTKAYQSGWDRIWGKKKECGITKDQATQEDTEDSGKDSGSQS